MRWDQAQGLDGLMAKLTACEKKVGRLISQYSILLHLPPRGRLPLLFSIMCSTSASSLLYYSNFFLMRLTLAHSSPPPLSLMPCFL